MSNVHEDLNRAHKVTDIVTWMMETGVRKEALPGLYDEAGWRHIARAAEVRLPSLRTRKLLYTTVGLED